MNIGVGYLVAVSLMLSSGVGAKELGTLSDSRTDIVTNYQVLKSKVGMGDKVRIIAKIKNIERGKPRSKTVPQEFLKSRDILIGRGIIAQRELPRLGIFVFEVDEHALDGLINSGLFERIVEDIPEPPTLVQSIEHIGADMAHNERFTGSGQAVVILDTGVESLHQFYADRLVEEACFSSNTSVATSLCPDGKEVEVGTNAARDCSPTEVLGCGHGTHVAGIAVGNNGSMSGVASSANIVAVQVFSKFAASYEGCGGVRCARSYRSDMLAALEWVLNDSTTTNIAAINMSIGGGSYISSCDTDVGAKDIAKSIADLRSAGIATVISAGNDGSSNSVSFPGCISSAITTGSTLDWSDTISWFSNSSSLVDILAPGSFITSSVVGGGYEVKSGTSMAAPHVTGAFAVMRAINPAASVGDIESSLKANGVSILDTKNNLSFPRLDLYASVISFEGTPIASLDKQSYSVIVNRETNFTAYSSSDPNNIPLAYIWDFGDGVGGYQTNAATVQHAYTSTGMYDLGLSVTNGNRYSDPSDTATVTVYDPAVISVMVSSLLL